MKNRGISDYQFLSILYQEHEKSEYEDVEPINSQKKIDYDAISKKLRLKPVEVQDRLIALHLFHLKNNYHLCVINNNTVSWPILTHLLSKLEEKEELKNITKSTLKSSQFAAIAAGISAIATLLSALIAIFK